MRRVYGRKKHENGRKEAGRARGVSPHVVCQRVSFCCMCRIEHDETKRNGPTPPIIVLADAEAVPVRALANRLRMHPVDVVKDLRGAATEAWLDPRRSRPFGRWRSSCEMTPNASLSPERREAVAQ